MQISDHTRFRAAERTARRLGWFSLALGLAEILFARHVARAAGLQGWENLVRACGAREIATGAGILLSEENKQAPWVWARVAGDVLDVATVASRISKDNPNALNAVGALVALAPVGFVDLKTARVLSEEKSTAQPARDYTTRSGFPRGVNESRGAAADVARDAAKWLSRPGTDVLPTSRVRAVTTPQPGAPRA
ncbi:MAG TPA: hypothetical protein VEB41_09195 [Burkholderiales bacterium]|nr:hypothetical protein [Burkholderiales bacterium]